MGTERTEILQTIEAVLAGGIALCLVVVLIGVVYNDER